MSHKIPVSVCPVCKAKLDRTDAIEGGKLTLTQPSPGDLTLCRCGTTLKFDQDLKLVEVDPIDLVQIALQNPEFYQYLQAVRKAIHKTNAEQDSK